MSEILPRKGNDKSKLLATFCLAGTEGRAEYTPFRAQAWPGLATVARTHLSHAVNLKIGRGVHRPEGELRIPGFLAARLPILAQPRATEQPHIKAKSTLERVVEQGRLRTTYFRTRPSNLLIASQAAPQDGTQACANMHKSDVVRLRCYIYIFCLLLLDATTSVLGSAFSISDKALERPDASLNTQGHVGGQRALKTQDQEDYYYYYDYPPGSYYYEYPPIDAPPPRRGKKSPPPTPPKPITSSLAITTFSPTTIPQTSLTITAFSPTTITQTSLAITTFSPTTIPQTFLAITTSSSPTIPQTSLAITTSSPTTIPQTPLAITTFSLTTKPQTSLAITTSSPTTIPQTSLAITTSSPTTIPQTSLSSRHQPLPTSLATSPSPPPPKVVSPSPTPPVTTSPSPPSPATTLPPAPRETYTVITSKTCSDWNLDGIYSDDQCVEALKATG
eukprot:gene9800-7689_t